MSKRDYYEILGVAKTATDGEMKVAFRKLAMTYHPDRNPGNAEADKKRRELVEVKNQGESLVHATEKSVKEYGDKVSADDKAAIETAITSLRTALDGDDVEVIKARTTDVMQASMKLGEAMYAANQAGEAGTEAPTGEAKKDDVIDADFQEVDDKDQKKRA